MKTRIAIWAVAGAIVVASWALYFMTTHQNLRAEGGLGWAILCLTCPIAIEAHHRMSLYFVLVVNAATYGLVGLVVETIPCRYQVRSISN